MFLEHWTIGKVRKRGNSEYISKCLASIALRVLSEECGHTFLCYTKLSGYEGCGMPASSCAVRSERWARHRASPFFSSRQNKSEKFSVYLSMDWLLEGTNYRLVVWWICRLIDVWTEKVSDGGIHIFTHRLTYKIRDFPDGILADLLTHRQQHYTGKINCQLIVWCSKAASCINPRQNPKTEEIRPWEKINHQFPDL